MSRITTFTSGYLPGMLSVFPSAIDSALGPYPTDTLYCVVNNAATILSQSLPYNGTYVVVKDASAFPPKGIIRVGPLNTTIPAIQPPSDLLNFSGVPGAVGNAELIWYSQIINNTFTGTTTEPLIRGYAGSRQNQWTTNTPVSNCVEAENHNALKDAIINMEDYIGTVMNPASGTLTDILNNLEIRYLSPTPLFRAYPLKGQTPLIVNFQSLCNSNVQKYLWDFGDGTTSTDINPTHPYMNEGTYTVSLNIITNTGAQGITTKNNYVQVIDEYASVFFYYTAIDNFTYNFVDQTEGEVTERLWVFGDGVTLDQDDPNIQTATHTYTSAGTYIPNLLVTFANQTNQRGYATTSITIERS